MYQIERQDQLYKTLPLALFFNPTIVVFSALTLLLPLSGVFAPGSLSVATKNSTDVSGPCFIPTGNLSTPNTPDSTSLSTEKSIGYWTGVTPRATDLATQCLAEQRIPDLPQACGPNCRYNVSVPSFFFQCIPNPSSLPFGQADPPAPPRVSFRPGPAIPGRNLTTKIPITLWNGTTDPNSTWGFYIAWKSNGPNGTSGNVSCSPVQAQYNVEVRRIAVFTSLSLIFLNVN
jgi:hypothetical protein